VKSLSFAESHLFLWRIQQLREEETTSPAQIESSENSESRAMRLWRQGGSVRFLCETSLLPRVRLGWGPAREHGKHMTEREKRKRERERERQREREKEREREREEAERRETMSGQTHLHIAREPRAVTSLFACKFNFAEFRGGAERGRGSGAARNLNGNSGGARIVPCGGTRDSHFQLTGNPREKFRIPRNATGRVLSLY